MNRPIFTTALILVSLFNIIAQKKEMLILSGEKISFVKMPICATVDTITGPSVQELITLENNADGTEADFDEFKQLFFPDDTLLLIVPGKQQYLATYKVIRIFSEYQHIDTIKFITEAPGLVKYEHALLFLKKNKDGCFNLTANQFIDIYLSKNNRWASYYAYEDYNHPNNVYTSLKPEKIDFTKEVSFDLTHIPQSTINKQYPSPYYKVIDNKAIAIFGNYIEDLVLIKMNGTLK